MQARTATRKDESCPSQGLFFERVELNLSIGSGLDPVNSAQVGGAIQSKEHSRVRYGSNLLAELTLLAQKIGP